MARGDADAPVDVETTGRHGDASGGLSVAELIARSRSTDAGHVASPARLARHLTAVAEPTAVAVAGAVAAAASIADQGEHVTEPLQLLEGIELPEPVALAPPAKKSRAGRDLRAAIGVGVTLGALVLISLFTYRPSFVALIVIAVCIGVYEMVAALSTVEARPPFMPLAAGGTAMIVVAWFRGPDGLVGALLLTVLGVLVWRLGEGAVGYLPDVASGALIALYVPFLAGFAALMAHPHDGAARIVLFILAVVCSDTGGYIAGVLFGKHPMAPMVSPKKSWEGFAGSLIGSATCGALLMSLCFHHEWWKGALFGLVIAVAATVGDLGESMIKRDLGIKDMGKLLPGHGGIMDRLDSLLACAPVAYLLMASFLTN